MNVPDGQTDKNIWVDFNLGSKSVSAFVKDDSCTDVGVFLTLLTAIDLVFIAVECN